MWGVPRPRVTSATRFAITQVGRGYSALGGGFASYLNASRRGREAAGVTNDVGGFERQRVAQIFTAGASCDARNTPAAVRSCEWTLRGTSPTVERATDIISTVAAAGS